jgi:hypothetical protein
MLDELLHPFVRQIIEKATNVSIENPVHFLPHDPHPERVQSTMLAAPRPEPVREPQKVLFVNLVEDRHYGLCAPRASWSAVHSTNRLFFLGLGAFIAALSLVCFGIAFAIARDNVFGASLVFTLNLPTKAGHFTKCQHGRTGKHRLGTEPPP